jgi:hypothetical protein
MQQVIWWVSVVTVGLGVGAFTVVILEIVKDNGRRRW